MRDHQGVLTETTSDSRRQQFFAANDTPTTTTGFTRPAKVNCNECNNVRSPSQAWWCRTCLKTICTQCNLFNRHTDHRSSLWSVEEMAQSLVNLFHARKAARNQKAAREELVIKDYMKQVEAYFARKLSELTREKEEIDQRLIKRICKAVNFDPDSALLLNDNANNAAASILPMCQILDDAKFEQLITQMSHLFDLDVDISECRLAANLSNGSTSVLPVQEPHVFANNLEIDLTSAGTGSQYLLNSGDLSTRANKSRSLSTDVIDNDRQTINKFTFNRSKSEYKNDPIQCLRRESAVPIEPKISILNETRLSVDDSSSDIDVTDSGTPRTLNGGQQEPASNTQKTRTAVGHSTQNSSATNNIASVVSSPASHRIPRPHSSMSHRPNLRFSRKEKADQISLPDNKDLSTMSLAGSCVGDDEFNVTAFSFGTSYLTRPIDVCILPNECLAVSDSCGGIYVTTKMGQVLQRILIEGGSASSLAYSSSSQKLFAGVLRKTGRSINVYDVASYDLVTSLPCPTNPNIEMTRSRWICAAPTGELYIVTGDNNLSALWRFSFASHDWVTIYVAKGTRYQYLNFVEQNEFGAGEYPSVTLLTCECLMGNLILLTIKNDKLLSQVVVQDIYPMRDHICSPASAVRDQFANLLIVDYANNGKVFLFEAPRNGQSKDRRLKLLMEVGAQEGMGICVRDGWCYVTCVNKKQVKAVQYKEI